MSELSERLAVQHGVAWIGGGGASEVFGCTCGHRSTNDDENDPFSAAHNRHVAEVTEAAVRETIAAATPNQEWGWGTNGWKPGDPDDFLQPMTAGHNVFTEADVRHNVERFGGIAVVRTIYTAPEPGPWKDADA